MSLSDPFVKKIAEKALLDYKICMKCNARNPPTARLCRRCRSRRLRPKKKKLMAKK